MYAVIETGGKQYKVSKGDIFDIEKIAEAATYTFDKVLLLSDEGKVTVGAPYIKGAFVSAKVLKQGKDDKVTTFKYRHKTNYHRTIGHRQRFTRVEIGEISHGA